MTAFEPSDTARALAREIAQRPRDQWHDAVAGVETRYREWVRSYLRGWLAAGGEPRMDGP